MPKPKDAPRFPGFDSPRFTQIPNQVFDELLADLSGAEWKVLSYIMRRTYGWHKDSDDLGLKQLTDGVRGVDRGTGLSKSTVAVALKSLEEWGLIERQHNRDEERGDLPTTYRVRLSDTGRVENRTHPPPTNGQGGVLPSDTQKIVPQNKEQKIDPLGMSDDAYTKLAGAGLPSAVRLELKQRYTRRGVLDRDGYREAALAMRQGR